jgi:hypothetical protein
LAPTVGQSAAASGVKFRLGPSGEKVASGLIWRFGTFDCVSDNLAHFENSFGNSGSFLDIGSHRFYVAKPFPEEVTNVFDPLCDADSDDGKSSDFCNMVEVRALEEDGGGGLPRSARPPLERPPPLEQDLPPPERDVLDAAITDLRAPLDISADPVKASEDLERTRLNFLKEAVDVDDTRRRVLSTINKYNVAVDGFRVARTRGTTRRTQGFEHRGLNVGDLGSQRNTVTEASSSRTHYALQRERRRALPRFRALVVR